MKTTKTIALSALALGAMVAASLVSADIVSLRGDQDLAGDSTAIERKGELIASGGIERSWKLQPPVIPHKTNNDRFSLKENTCLNCHSTDTYKKEKAPKIGDSHFVDATGAVLTEMNMRRYFCSQCQVPQTDATPLVENLFEGDK